MSNLHDDSSYARMTENPAIALYNYWYAIAQFQSPNLLDRNDTDRCSYDNFRLGDDNQARVYVDTWWGDKPVFRLQDTIVLQPNGRFAMHTSVTSDSRWTLRWLEKHTFLQWSYVIRDKVLAVQEWTRSNGSANYSWVDGQDFEHPRPYWPLDNYQSLFVNHHVLYHLVKKNDWWHIEPYATFHDSRSRASKSTRPLYDAQEILHQRLSIAERRYARNKRSAELAAERASGVIKSRATAQTQQLWEMQLRTFGTALKAGMTIYEPKVGPGGAQQLVLPIEKEVATLG